MGRQLVIIGMPILVCVSSCVSRHLKKVFCSSSSAVIFHFTFGIFSVNFFFYQINFFLGLYRSMNRRKPILLSLEIPRRPHSIVHQIPLAFLGNT